MSYTKVIHVPRRYVWEEWGGTETVIAQIARQQKLAGLDPRVFTSMALASKADDTILGTPIRRFKHSYPFFGLKPEQKLALDKKGGSLISVPLLRALCKEPEVKILHAHAINRVGGIVRTAARWRHLPYVVSLHGGVFDVPVSEKIDLQKPVKGHIEWGKLAGALLGSRHVLRDADYVICVGKKEAEKAATELKHNRVGYLPNGVDINQFSTGNGSSFRQTHKIPERAFVLLNIGRIDPQKNQLLLVEAFAQFRQLCPEAVLVLIGPETQPNYAKQIRDLVQAKGLNFAVRIIPGLTAGSSELINAYHGSNVFVLPSRHEPFGIVALEAWSSKLPVIASNVGGLQHLITHGRNGLLFDPADPHAADAISTHLRSIHRNQILAKELALNGFNEAKDKYSWESIWQQLQGIYAQAEEHSYQKWTNSIW